MIIINRIKKINSFLSRLKNQLTTSPDLILTFDTY